MGNANSRNEINTDVPDAHPKSPVATLSTESTMSRSPSGAEITEKFLTQLVPIEKLSEVILLGFQKNKFY